ncbi:hypothetical protein ABD87_14650 [Lysinibacillus sphaericus]|uniref:hypothetical protein n=1 Tax=Lysinibacillus sphaericus TaxID=1421 RepID=UPI0018CF12E1|nr:hypothetical protein [Lysinibacillus sphaericus]MBG9730740.1 hypothetical protein [Lysinibacillus sphaericus]
MTQNTIAEVNWLLSFEALQLDVDFVQSFYSIFSELSSELNGSFSIKVLSNEEKDKLSEKWGELFEGFFNEVKSSTFVNGSAWLFNNGIQFVIGEGNSLLLLINMKVEEAQEKENWLNKIINLRKEKKSDNEEWLKKMIVEKSSDFAAEVQCNLQIIELNDMGLFKLREIID